MLRHHVVEDRRNAWFSKLWVGHANDSFKASIIEYAVLVLNVAKLLSLYN
jgi:hypothetical protein